MLIKFYITQYTVDNVRTNNMVTPSGVGITLLRSTNFGKNSTLLRSTLLKTVVFDKIENSTILKILVVQEIEKRALLKIVVV